MTGVNLTFAPDTEAALQAAATLVNTGLRRDGTDAMSTVADLDRFYAEFGYTGRHHRDDAEVAQVRAVRDRLRPLFSAGRDEAGPWQPVGEQGRAPAVFGEIQHGAALTRPAAAGA